MSDREPLKWAAVCVFLIGLVMFSTRQSSVAEIGKPSTPVLLKHSATGSYLSFSSSDGLFVVSNASKPARLRLVTISETMVMQLRQQSLDFEKASRTVGLGGIVTKTRSGCSCSGVSNEHGFGRYCYEWESSVPGGHNEEAWCYVNNTCGAARPRSFGGRKGSFGHRFEKCTAASPPSPPPPPPNPPYSPYPSPPPPPPAIAPGSTFVAPPGCACSGFSNKHGFGASCFAWEVGLEGASKTPWCYVNSDCPSAQGRKGSFGKQYADCVAVPPASVASARAVAPPATGGPAGGEPARGGGASGEFSQGWLARMFGRRLGAADLVEEGGGRLAGRSGGRGTINRLPPKGRVPGLASPPIRRPIRNKAQRLNPYLLALGQSDETLMSNLRRFRARYVAILSDEAHTYLNVELPPHKLSLRPHALSSRLSISSVFALVKPPGRRRASKETLLISLGAAAYLTLCPGGGADPAAHVTNTLCTGFRERKGGDEAFKLLRRPSVPHAPALFTLERVG